MQLFTNRTLLASFMCLASWCSYAAGRIGFDEIVKLGPSSQQYCQTFGLGKGLVERGYCFMTQADAVRYCASQKKHLPSIRELAELAARMGAKGIVKDATFPSQISAINLDGTFEEFKFLSDGYKAPDDDLLASRELGEGIGLWSSSTDIDYEIDSYFLRMDSGDLGIRNLGATGLVQCAEGAASVSPDPTSPTSVVNCSNGANIKWYDLAQGNDPRMKILWFDKEFDLFGDSRAPGLFAFESTTVDRQFSGWVMRNDTGTDPKEWDGEAFNYQNHRITISSRYMNGNTLSNGTCGAPH